MYTKKGTTRDLRPNLSEKLTRIQEEGLISPFLVDQFTKKVRRQFNDYRSY